MELTTRHRPTALLHERQSVRSYPSHAARLPSWYLTQEIWTGVGSAKTRFGPSSMTGAIR